MTRHSSDGWMRRPTAKSASPGQEPAFRSQALRANSWASASDSIPNPVPPQNHSVAAKVLRPRLPTCNTPMRYDFIPNG
jgi:hypothetical protein